MRRPLAAYAALLVGSCALTFTSAGAAHPLRLTVGTLGSIGSLDPRHGTSSIAREIWKLQYPSLTSLDPKTLDPAPGLAVAWSPTGGGKGWTYDLRPDLEWSDGRAVTADDVVYSLDHARDEHWPYAAGIVDGLAARALNPHSVQVTSTGAGRPGPGLLLHVVPAHVFETVGDTDSDVAKLGVSDGRWHVVAKAADSVQLDALADPASSALQQIVFRTYPNATSLIDALAHKQVDVVSGLPDSDIDRLAALSNVTVDHASDGTEYVLRCTSFPDERLRRVVSLAIDRTALVADTVNGVGTPVAVDARPGLARAELLALDPNRDRETTVAVPRDPTSRRIGAFVRKALAAVGLVTRTVASGRHDTGNVTVNLVLDRVAARDLPRNVIELFEPDTLQAFRTDNVTGFLNEPEIPSLVVFGPTVAQYAQLTAAPPPPREQSTNTVYAVGAAGVLALGAAVYAAAAWVRRRSIEFEGVT